MSSNKLFTNEDVSHIIRNRVNKLNEEIHQLQMENIILHNNNIKLYKQIDELKKEGNNDDIREQERDKRPSIFTRLRQYERQ